MTPFSVAYVKVTRSTSAHAEYVAAMKMIHEHLSPAAQKPKHNSLLNALHFHTREELLNEYFCLNCPEGYYAVRICSTLKTHRTDFK